MVFVNGVRRGQAMTLESPRFPSLHQWTWACDYRQFRPDTVVYSGVKQCRSGSVIYLRLVRWMHETARIGARARVSIGFAEVILGTGHIAIRDAYRN